MSHIFSSTTYSDYAYEYDESLSTGILAVEWMVAVAWGMALALSICRLVAVNARPRQQHLPQ